ncbi:hypothetical protein [Streptomyces sp. NRRL B-1347]|uniref:hypothetical protein n=1 Tax=Streptomyces sp. NRRL B-1347 TaxID=1476877 RepID=UPI000ACF76E6|nr:hypothetical protein [Streptomyces sp. NRRL B-1347]
MRPAAGRFQVRNGAVGCLTTDAAEGDQVTVKDTAAGVPMVIVGVMIAPSR